MRFDEWSCMKLCSDCRTCGHSGLDRYDMTPKTGTEKLVCSFLSALIRGIKFIGFNFSFIFLWYHENVVTKSRSIL